METRGLLGRRGSACLALLVLSCLFGCRAGAPGGAREGDRGEQTGPDLQRCAFERNGMGTLFRVVLFAADPIRGEAAANEAFELLHRLERSFSDYIPGSELERLSHSTDIAAGAGVEVSPDLYSVLGVAFDVASRTGGAFDPTVGPYVRLWRRARRQGTSVDLSELALQRQRVSFRALKLEPQATVRLMHERMRLDLGGIGKGYAAQRMLESLAHNGFESALIDAGGDLVLGAPPPGRAGWRVRIENGLAASADFRLELAHCAVASSGDRWQWHESEGRRFGHILDPRTGLGLERRVAATVIAPDGAVADALASALCVLGPERAPEFMARFEGASAQVLGATPDEEDGSIVMFRSRSITEAVGSWRPSLDRATGP